MIGAITMADPSRTIPLQRAFLLFARPQQLDVCM